MRRLGLPMLVLAMAVLAACSVRPRTVVLQRPGAPPSAQAAHGAREHVVVRGDTLYGIAFRHGMDYRDLARWNAISAPYTIYPGQRLSLTGPRSVPASAPVVAAAPTPRSGGQTAPVASSTGVAGAQAGRPVAAAPAASAPNRASATQPAAPVAAATSSTPVAPAASTAPPTPPLTTPIVATGATRLAQGINWRWPANGQLISRYVAGDQTRQGVGIGGSSGQPVVAAADGEVVYSGSGLIGYGELIIVRHSDEFLSAYGHNRKRLVNEGQKVKAGQQIAEMGRTGASRDMLHFEIRKNGKPLDPLGFLPAR